MTLILVMVMALWMMMLMPVLKTVAQGLPALALDWGEDAFEINIDDDTDHSDADEDLIMTLLMVRTLSMTMTKKISKPVPRQFNRIWIIVIRGQLVSLVHLRALWGKTLLEHLKTCLTVVTATTGPNLGE